MTIVGAMVVGPEFGPLAAAAVALVRKDFRLVRRSATALVGVFISVTTIPAVGFAVAATTGEPHGNQACATVPPVRKR